MASGAESGSRFRDRQGVIVHGLSSGGVEVKIGDRRRDLDGSAVGRVGSSASSASRQCSNERRNGGRRSPRTRNCVGTATDQLLDLATVGRVEQVELVQRQPLPGELLGPRHRSVADPAVAPPQRPGQLGDVPAGSVPVGPAVSLASRCC